MKTLQGSGKYDSRYWTVYQQWSEKHDIGHQFINNFHKSFNIGVKSGGLLKRNNQFWKEIIPTKMRNAPKFIDQNGTNFSLLVIWQCQKVFSNLINCIVYEVTFTRRNWFNESMIEWWCANIRNLQPTSNNCNKTILKYRNGEKVYMVIIFDN